MPQNVAFLATSEEGVNGRMIMLRKRAFKDNRYVRHIVIGRNIQSIGKETFEGCLRLKKIIIKA